MVNINKTNVEKLTVGKQTGRYFKDNKQIFCHKVVKELMYFILFQMFGFNIWKTKI